jgi:hypothetical protein
LDGTPGGIRTHDLLVRSQTLYPAELPALKHSNYTNSAKLAKLLQIKVFFIKLFNKNGGEQGIRTLDTAFDRILA